MLFVFLSKWRKSVRACEWSGRNGIDGWEAIVPLIKTSIQGSDDYDDGTLLS